MGKRVSTLVVAIVAVVVFGLAPAAKGQIDLTVENLQKRKKATLTVTGALPGNRVYFLYSVRGTGSTFVPFFNIHIDLKRPIITITGKLADRNGVAVANPWVALNQNFVPPAGTTIWFQALEPRPDPINWDEVVKSNVVEEKILPR